MDADCSPPYYLLGNERFSLKQSLMRLYPVLTVVEEDHICNESHSRGRRVIAFGILISRWIILQKPKRNRQKMLFKLSKANRKCSQFTARIYWFWRLLWDNNTRWLAVRHWWQKIRQDVIKLKTSQRLQVLRGCNCVSRLLKGVC